MIYEDETFAAVKNVGLVDSLVRGTASIAILVAEIMMPSITALTLFGLTLLVIYTGLTAFIAWDPLYAMMKRAEPRPSAQAASTIAAGRRREDQAYGDGHKKAA